MKKLFTLLTLLVAIVTSAWADNNTTLIDGITLPSTPTGTYTGGTTVSHNGTNNAVVVDGSNNAVMQAVAPSYGSPTAANFTWTNATDGTDGNWSTTGTTWDAPDGSLFVGSSAYTTSENAHYVSFARRGNLRNNRTFAYRFTNCIGVSALVKSQGDTDAASACLAVYEVGAGSALTSAGTASSKKKAVDIITVDELSTSKTYVAYIYGMNGSNGELYEIAFLAPTGDPVINAANTSITTTTSGVDVTEDITVTGANLTSNGTLTASLSPAVTGLSVALASSSIDASGAISTTATLTYNATANAKGTTTLTLSDGTTTKNVTITYNASVVSWTLQSVSSATTWDFSTLSGGKQYSGDDLNVEHVYANIAEITCPAGFDGTALAFTGEFPLRSGKGIAQNGTLKFNTSVPGVIVVKFSDTGTSASSSAVKRYLVVNGNQTEYWASREKTGDGAYAAQLNVTTGAIAVPAGDVTISGSSALVYSKLDFTPSVPVTIAASGYSSLASAYGLDFANATPAGLEAYVASAVTASGVTLNAVTEAPASTGVILKGTPGETYNIPVKADAAAVGTNYLHAAVAAYNCAADEVYILKGGKFCKVTAASTVPAGKAYLLASDVPASAPELEFNFGGTTGIDEVRGKMEDVRGEYYNLAGQRVAQPTKGLYIVNGRKVVIK